MIKSLLYTSIVLAIDSLKINNIDITEQILLATIFTESFNTGRLYFYGHKVKSLKVEILAQNRVNASFACINERHAAYDREKMAPPIRVNK